MKRLFIFIFTFCQLMHGSNNEETRIFLTNTPSNNQVPFRNKDELIEAVINQTKQSINTGSLSQLLLQLTISFVPSNDLVYNAIITQSIGRLFVPLANSLVNFGAIHHIVNEMKHAPIEWESSFKNELQKINFEAISKNDLEKKIVELGSALIFTKNMNDTAEDKIDKKLMVSRFCTCAFNVASLFGAPYGSPLQFAYGVNTILNICALYLVPKVKTYQEKKYQEIFKQNIEKILHNNNFTIQS